jgi:hypothetical protein
MKYYRIIDPEDINSEDRKKLIHIGWKEILNPCIEKGIEDDINFLYSLLVNLPTLEESGELVEKTVLLARQVSEDDFDDSDIQAQITEDLSICYNV